MRSWIGSSKAPAVVGLVWVLATVAWPASAAAQTVPFKVFITELWQLDDGVDPGLGFMGDYYAKVTINGVAQENDGACDDPSSGGIIVPYQVFKNFKADSDCGARTPWAFTKMVDRNQDVTVRIQIFDSDLSFDDEGDAKPGSGDAVEFTVSATDGKWRGGDADADFNWPQTCSRPGLSLGGRNVNVCWQASYDTDDDGLLDVWETDGVDSDNDGVVDVNLATLGANARRKDAFVEADFIAATNHTHRPLQAAIAKVVTSFADAPVANPDGTSGIQLHVDVGPIYAGGPVFSVVGTTGTTGTYGDLGGGGSAIPEVGNTIIEAFTDPQGTTGTTFASLRDANFNPRRELAFRYMIFGHQTNARRAFNDCTSGEASRTRREFFVTLGGTTSANVACHVTDAGGASVGSIDEQAGTLMHELGHTLGLRHGGDENLNDKPNHLSVMNYTFQDCEVPVSAGFLRGGCDYSGLVLGALLAPLDETDLDECVGVGAGLGKMDWNGDGSDQGGSCVAPTANTTADVNNDGVCVEAGNNKELDTTASGDDRRKEKGINDGPNRVCNTTKSGDDSQKTAVGSTPSQPDIINSHDDWAAVNPALIGFSNGFGTGNAPTDQEPDPDRIRQSREHLRALTAPAITLDQTGPPTARPGDGLTYNVAVRNTGRGPALSSVLVETAPDGVSQTSTVGTIVAGGAVTQSMAFIVPADACPGGLTGARATLTFKDFVGNDLVVSDTTPLEVLDVSAPTLDVVLSPNVLWPPNHKFVQITATIATADNCDPAPAIRLVSITSNEPATGFLGGGDKGPDIADAAFGTDDRTFSLRSERGTGKNTGRVYTVTYRATDRSGNVTTKVATVTVPRDGSGQ